MSRTLMEWPWLFVCLPFPVILCKRRPFQNMRRESRIIPGSGSRIRAWKWSHNSLRSSGVHKADTGWKFPFYNSAERAPQLRLYYKAHGSFTITSHQTQKSHRENMRERNIVESSFKYRMRDRSISSTNYPSIPSLPKMTFNHQSMKK